MYQEKVKQGVQQAMTQCPTINHNTTITALQQLNQTFTTLYNDLREGIQESTKDEMASLMRKLHNNEDITSQEIELIRLWIIGDAHSYIKMENNYEEWIQEAQRLVEVVKSLSTKKLTPSLMGDLQGVARDATRTLSDIAFYKENLERAKNFEDSVKNLTADNKLFLAEMLKAKMTSDNV
ncbi:MAG: hypothetical protein H6750_18070 [Nitrospiraceae bacterium]|nr:hypothetical protein [Nitrospira sp.]MCB9776213.1 hypothetical protein [Nitrospiraceae bacterium]